MTKASGKRIPLLEIACRLLIEISIFLCGNFKKAHIRGGDNLGKIVVATFTESEEEIWKRVLSALDKDINPETIHSPVLRFENNLEIHPQQRQIVIAGVEVSLSYLEYEILYFLTQRPGWVFSQEQIFEAVWRIESDSCFHAVANTISRLIKRIEPNPKSPIYIKTVPGHGYKLAVQSIQTP